MKVWAVSGKRTMAQNEEADACVHPNTQTLADASIGPEQK